jgi:hypothetical protein
MYVYHKHHLVAVLLIHIPFQEKHNKHLLTSGEQQWTFGQIMALVQIISTVNEVFHFLMSLYAPRNEVILVHPGTIE